MAAHFGPESRAILKTSMGDMTIEFFPGKAPRTCEHFVKLAKQGFYDGLTFHRVLKDFMVQTGCPRGDGTGGPGFTMRAEFNDTPHVKGTVSLARGSDPHSGGSQFFICHGEARYLDSRYSAFARVVEGLEVLDRIASVPVEENRYKERSVPRDPIFLNSVIIEGVEVEAEEPIVPRRAEGSSGSRGESDGDADDGDGEDGSGGDGDEEGFDGPEAGAEPDATGEPDTEGGGESGGGGERRRRSRRGRSRGKGGRRPQG